MSLTGSRASFWLAGGYILEFPQANDTLATSALALPLPGPRPAGGELRGLVPLPIWGMPGGGIEPLTQLSLLSCGSGCCRTAAPSVATFAAEVVATTVPAADVPASEATAPAASDPAAKALQLRPCQS
jgi:hypothetical protein